MSSIIWLTKELPGRSATYIDVLEDVARVYNAIGWADKAGLRMIEVHADGRDSSRAPMLVPIQLIGLVTSA